MLRIAVLASHQGSNFQAIADACSAGELNATVAVLICNNSKAPVLARAERAGVRSAHLSSMTHPDPAALDAAICSTLTRAGADLVVLAGYMKKLGPLVLSAYENRIINVHPSLLPRHGGEGLYGLHVHAAVLAAGDAVTGATVHLVTAEYDQGDILRQASVAVNACDTTESLAARVHNLEHRLLLETIKHYSHKS